MCVEARYPIWLASVRVHRAVVTSADLIRHAGSGSAADRLRRTRWGTRRGVRPEVGGGGFVAVDAAAEWVEA